MANRCHPLISQQQSMVCKTRTASGTVILFAALVQPRPRDCNVSHTRCQSSWCIQNGSPADIRVTDKRSRPHSACPLGCPSVLTVSSETLMSNFFLSWPRSRIDSPETSQSADVRSLFPTVLATVISTMFLSHTRVP